MNYWMSLLLFFATVLQLNGQYTDLINSNRPGISIGAFSVGKGVVQLETATEYRKYKHYSYNDAEITAGVGFISLRWGLLSERLEINYQGQYLAGDLILNGYTEEIKLKQNGFLKNFVGVKYLLFDPFKKERKPNLYSWKANNSFQLRDLIPAVSITAGVNINTESRKIFSYENIFSALYKPLLYENLKLQLESEPKLSYQVLLATQTHFLSKWVLVSNFMVNRIGSKYLEKSFALTLTHSFSPRGSIYIENQGIYGAFNNNFILRSGFAYLISKDLQVEVNVGSNIKTTPSLFLTNFGISYRLDFHKDFVMINYKVDKKLEKIERKQNKLSGKTTKKSEKSLAKALRKKKKLNKKIKK